MRWMALSLLAPVVALFSFDVQRPFRRDPRGESSSIADWVAAAKLPAFAVLPSTSAIIEANSGARALFPEEPLLQSDLITLFPEHADGIRDTLAQAQQDGASSLRVTWNGDALTLAVTTISHNGTALAALLCPYPYPPELSSLPEASNAFPALELSREWLVQPVEQQVHTLLSLVMYHWPLRAAAILKRQEDSLYPLLSAGEDVSWKKLFLSDTDRELLLRCNDTVNSTIDDAPATLFPVHLSLQADAWGALALVPIEAGRDVDALRAAGEQAALLLGLLLAQALGRSNKSYPAQPSTASEPIAVRDHLLHRSRRGILLVNSEGQIEAINEAACTLLGWPAADVTGRPLSSLLEDLGPLGSKIAVAVDGSRVEERPASMARLQRPGKRGRDVSFAVERIRELPSHALIFLEDQEGTAAVGETQHHLDRLAVLGKMSAMIAHDLRNPLASILYGIEALAESLGEESPEAGSIRLLLQEGERVHRIIEDILSISRQPSLTISLCSLRTLMDQVYDTYQRQLEEKLIHVRRYHDPSLPMIEGDPVRLGQMLSNLISNAIEALPYRGQIEVILRPIALEQMAARGINPDQEERLQGGVEVLIRDNGPGIPEVHREQVFEPLFTTKSSGTGLGLAIVRTIVEQHRGLIFLDSEVGKGTTFQVFLPQLSVSAYQQAKQRDVEDGEHHAA